MQPYFVPYLGYFHLLDAVETFVIYDCVQYIRRGWIHRNRLQSKKMTGWEYVHLKVQQTARETLIKDLKLNIDQPSRKKLLDKITSIYATSPQFLYILPLVEKIVSFQSDDLTEFLESSLRDILHFIGIKVDIVRSSSMNVSAEYRGQRRIVEVCKRVGCTDYINPSGGRALYDADFFAAEGLKLGFLNSTFIPYVQHLHQGTFIPGLSILDVVMENHPGDFAKHISSYTIDRASYL